MGLFKILIPCMVISSVCMRAQSRGDNLFKIKSHGLSNQNKECFCIPKNPQNEKVTEHLSPNGEKPNRLIVYLFKNRGTNNVTVYVPNKDKQSVLPDFTLDDGDSLDHDKTENVDQLFDLYPEDVTQSKDIIGPAKIPGGISHNVIDLDYTQNVPEFEQDNNREIVIESQLNKDEIDNNNQNKEANIPSEQQLPISIADYFNYPGSSNEAPNVQILKLPITEVKNVLKTESRPVNSPSVIQDTPIKLNTPEDIEILSGTPKGLDDIQDTDTKTSSENLDIAQPYDGIQIENVKENELFASDPNLSIQTDPTINIHRPYANTEKYKNIKISPQRQYDPEDFSIHYSDDSVSYMQPNKQQNINNPNIIPNNIHPKFKKWFQEQIRLIEMRRPSIKHTINLRKFLSLILKSIYRNGLKISSSGDLQDANGNIVRISDLKLRPIILGDPVQHDNCNIPYNVEYLDAVLVTLVYPPKILGIISLGKNNLAHKLYGIHHPCKSGLCEHRPCCKKWPCYNTKPNAKRFNIEYKNVEPPKAIIKVERGSLLNSNPKSYSLLGSFKKSRRMNNESDISITNASAEKAETVDELPVVEGIAENERAEDIQDIEENEDSLGIRIIGGTPATSSGTPVSIKGRTGVISD